MQCWLEKGLALYQFNLKVFKDKVWKQKPWRTMSCREWKHFDS